VTGLLLLVTGASWGVGAAIDLVVGTGRRWARSMPYLLGLVGSVSMAVAGVRAVLGATTTLELGSTLGVGETVVRIDPLAGLFLTLVAVLGVAVSGSLVGWVQPEGRVHGRGVGAGYLLLLGAVVVVVVAGDAFTFLFGWESLTVASFILTGARRGDARSARASWATLGVGVLGGAALLFGLLLMAAGAHSDLLSAWSRLGPGPVHTIASVLVIAGVGAKVGIVPLQVWLPLGYPSSPGPTRAAMAGISVNVGFYGLWRFFGILGRPPIWLAVVVLVLGGATALLGIAFASVQGSLNRVIAYSSVEHAGIIFVAYGVALAGAATQRTGVIAVGLLAGSLQVLAHAVAKSALFASSAFFESNFGSDDLERLRGVGVGHRASATSFAIASATLAGLPPTIGFVSEWFVLEALLQEFRLQVLAVRLAMALAGALVALTAGIASLCFVRLLGLTLLGRPGAWRPGRAPKARHRVDGEGLGSFGSLFMATCCLGLAAAAPWVIRYLSLGLAPIVAYHATIGSLKSPWVLQPVYSNFSILSPSWLFVVMPVGVAIVALASVVFSRGRLLRVRRVPAWRCASAGFDDRARYSAFGYANALRHVLSNVLGTRSETITVDEAAAEAPCVQVEVRSSVVEPVEAYLYRPTKRAWLWLSARARRLQSGRLDAYVGYMLVALVALLAVVVAMK